MQKFYLNSIRYSILTALTVLLICLLYGPGLNSIAAYTADEQTYEKEVLPILQKHCLKCHGGEEKIKGGLNLKSRQAIIAGGDSGTAFDEKNPSASLLLKAIQYKDEAYQMPPKGKMPDTDIAVVEKWILAGLNMPAGSEKIDKPAHKPTGGVVTEEAKKYWAYQVVKKPATTLTTPSGTAQIPSIDQFIEEKLAAKKLKANPQADKLTLIRRLYYDLIGLPPTPEEVEEFTTGKVSIDQLIDRLLGSQHYGEKWGRHWLDIVRYAETNGYERDDAKPNAWRYRDYVIESFNKNKPFDRFLKEQVAGDELYPDDRDAIIATGFYRLGIWDDEPADPKLAIYDGYDDIVATIGQGFMATTFNCARCHDHKVDPIPATDYYKMVAFVRDIKPFSDNRSVNSKFNRTDISPPEVKKKYQAQLEKRQSEISRLKEEMKPIEDAAIKKMPPEDQLKVDDGKRDEVVKKIGKYLDEKNRADYQNLKLRLKELESQPTPHQDLALSINHCDVSPPTTYVLIRGNPNTPGTNEVRPGFPAVLDIPDPQCNPTSKSSGRRAVLANWLTQKENPFTARVFVNRVWQYHFGRGIVASSNDFGKLGDKPTHPELLDFLAYSFMESGWDIKKLHKQILQSQAYQRSSSAAANDNALSVDPANQYLWRFSKRRLGAEEVRDSILHVSGNLNLKMGGPSVFPKIPVEVLAGQSVPGQGWHFDPKKPDEGNRRTVYVHVKRSLQVPVLANHDQADTDSSCPARYTTTVPTQALSMMNGEFTNIQAGTFANRIQKTHNDEMTNRISLAIQLTTGRKPSQEEIKKDAEFIRKLSELKLGQEEAFRQYCLMLLNTNEFLYVD